MDSHSLFDVSTLKLHVKNSNIIEVERITSNILRQVCGDSGKLNELICTKEMVDVFASILQNIPSFTASNNVVGIIYQKLINKSSKNQMINAATNQNIVQPLFNAMVHHKDSLTTNNSSIYRLHTVIKKLAKKDKKICMKARLSGFAKVTAGLVKLPKTKFATQCCLLTCLKVFLLSNVTASSLGKDGLIGKLIANVRHLHENSSFKCQLLMALSLEALILLLKLKINIKRMVQLGSGIDDVIVVMQTWYKCQTKIAKRITKASLTIISQSTDLRSGRKAIIDCDGISKLYKMATSLSPKADDDSILMGIFSVIVKCLPRISLPAPSTSPLEFQLPNHKFDCSVHHRHHTSGSDDEILEDVGLDEVIDDTDSSGINKVLHMMESLKAGDEFSDEQLTPFDHFFPERPCYHNSTSMHGYPCCHGYSQPVAADQISCDYSTIHENTKEIGSFVKIAYPDLIGAQSIPSDQVLWDGDPDLLRKKVLYELDQLMEPERTMDNVVYDLDSLLEHDIPLDKRPLSNNDELCVGKKISNSQTLQFESRFECGNLRKAIQVDSTVYNLVISPDVNACGRHQWFYFQVSAMEANVSYTFNIINCEKLNSQFNYGMQPLVFSVKDSLSGQGGWKRIGSHICYHKNRYMKFTTSFTLQFPHSWDVCYLSYHFPYTYTTLQLEMNKWMKKVNKSKDIYYRQQKLCSTLGHNQADLLTITSSLNEGLPIKERKYMFLTARVHPGEANASWMMKGSIDYLLSDEPSSRQLRSHFIFKIIPMLNPDGVINGMHRCSLIGCDLNRCWSNPKRSLHPVIYHSKALIAYVHRHLRQPPLVFCDFHGHSRKKNVFMFGCDPRKSWHLSDRTINQSNPPDVVPRLCSRLCKAFSYSDCDFTIEKSRESTARVAIWRTFSCSFSYTLESTYCGFNHGIYKNLQINTRILEEMGSELCQAFAYLIPSNKNQIADLPLVEISDKSHKRNSQKAIDDRQQSSPTDSDELSANLSDENDDLTVCS